MAEWMQLQELKKLFQGYLRYSPKPEGVFALYRTHVLWCRENGHKPFPLEEILDREGGLASKDGGKR